MYHTHCILISASLCILISALLGPACPLLGLLKCAYMPTSLRPESSQPALVKSLHVRWLCSLSQHLWKLSPFICLLLQRTAFSAYVDSIKGVWQASFCSLNSKHPCYILHVLLHDLDYLPAIPDQRGVLMDIPYSMEFNLCIYSIVLLSLYTLLTSTQYM